MTQFNVSQFLAADPEAPTFEARAITARITLAEDGKVIATDVAIQTTSGYICFWYYEESTRQEHRNYLAMRSQFAPFFAALDGCTPTITENVQTFSAPLTAAFQATLLGTFEGAHENFRITLPEGATVYSVKEVKHRK